MIDMLYCPACDLATSATATGSCVQCGGAVVDLTPFLWVAERRAIDTFVAKTQAWAQEQYDLCSKMVHDAQLRNDTQQVNRWMGSGTMAQILLDYLEAIDSEAKE